MTRRITRTAIELASDIGSKAMDLYQHGDRAALEAFKVLVTVNTEVFAWLRDRLVDLGPIEARHDKT